jgi:hypothetical protein
MRDAAEDCKNKSKEMDAYYNIGRVLEIRTEYKQAILAFKRLL